MLEKIVEDTPGLLELSLLVPFTVNVTVPDMTASGLHVTKLTIVNIVFYFLLTEIFL